jgi:hypothetical protein
MSFYDPDRARRMGGPWSDEPPPETRWRAMVRDWRAEAERLDHLAEVHAGEGDARGAHALRFTATDYRHAADELEESLGGPREP